MHPNPNDLFPGVTIGDGAIIGTKAVVTQNVLPYTIADNVLHIMNGDRTALEASSPEKPI